MKKKVNILLESDVAQLGHKGELKQVALGYAHNYLLPKGLARLATAELVSQIQKRQLKKLSQQEEAASQAKKLAKLLAGKTFKIKVKTSPEGKLFAALGEKDILSILAKNKIDTANIKLLSKPIKQTGEHKVELDLGYNQKAEIKLIVSSK